MIRPIVKDILFLGQSEQGVRHLVQIIWKRYSAIRQIMCTIL